MSPVYNGGGCTTVVASASALPYKNVVLYVPPAANITVTITDQYGVTTTGLVLAPGYHAISPRVISAVSGGTLYYFHNQDHPINFA
jgi:hypothetical protein